MRKLALRKAKNCNIFCRRYAELGVALSSARTLLAVAVDDTDRAVDGDECVEEAGRVGGKCIWLTGYEVGLNQRVSLVGFINSLILFFI